MVSNKISKKNQIMLYNPLYQVSEYKNNNDNDDFSIKNEINNQIYYSLQKQKIQDIEKKEQIKKTEEKSHTFKNIKMKEVDNNNDDDDKNDNLTLSDMIDDNKNEDMISLSENDSSELSLGIVKQNKRPFEDIFESDSEFTNSSDSDFLKNTGSKGSTRPTHGGKGKQPRKGKGKGLYTGSKSIRSKNNLHTNDYQSDYESISDDDSYSENYNKTSKVKSKVNKVNYIFYKYI